MLAHRRIALVGAAAIGLTLAGGGLAAAVSGGGYSPQEQGCTVGADSNANAGTEPGCHNMQILVQDGNGNTYAEAGINQEAQNDNPHGATFAISPDGTATPQGTVTGTGISGGADTNYQPIPPGQCGLFDLVVFPLEAAFGGQPCNLDPTQWSPPDPNSPPTVSVTPQVGTNVTPSNPDPTNVSLYFGADDNLDTGEHDGADGLWGTTNSQNGPSDGGAIVVNWHPLQTTDWVAAVSDPSSAAYTIGTNPVPVADAGFGMCADGVCSSTQTRQRSVYQGGTQGSRDVYNYQGKNWDPSNCSSGSPKDEQSCYDPDGDGETATSGDTDNDGDGTTMDQYRQQEYQNVYAEPGVQVYEDPDPQGSPVGPYPLPAAYVGTCGVVLGGGPMDFSGSGLPTNSAGQLVVSSPANC